LSHGLTDAIRPRFFEHYKHEQRIMDTRRLSNDKASGFGTVEGP
jgi:hypothetical protein